MTAYIVGGSAIAYLLVAACVFGWLAERKGFHAGDAGPIAAFWPFASLVLGSVGAVQLIGATGRWLFRPRPNRVDIPTAKVVSK